MAQHALGTLMLPWSTSTQRATKRVPVDPALLGRDAHFLPWSGVVMVFSASAVVAGNRFHDPWYFLKRQVAWLVVGLLVMHVVSRIDYRIWKKLAIPLLCGATLLLVLVLIPSLGNVAKGARRWLHLGPINIQPAEVAKFVAVIYAAAYLTKKQDQIAQFARGLLPPLIVIGLLSGLVLLEPDLGTVVVMGLVVATDAVPGRGAHQTPCDSLALCAR
jgi:cell division protein FtsW